MSGLYALLSILTLVKALVLYPVAISQYHQRVDTIAYLAIDLLKKLMMVAHNIGIGGCFARRAGVEFRDILGSPSHSKEAGTGPCRVTRSAARAPPPFVYGYGSRARASGRAPPPFV